MPDWEYYLIVGELVNQQVTHSLSVEKALCDGCVNLFTGTTTKGWQVGEWLGRRHKENLNVDDCFVSERLAIRKDDPKTNILEPMAHTVV